MTLMSDLASFYERLRAHDWFYPMTEDPRVHWRGHHAEEDLRREARDDPMREALFHAFKIHYLSRMRGDTNPPRLPTPPTSP